MKIVPQKRKQHAPLFWEALNECGLGASDVELHLGRSRTYVSQRMSGKKPWTLPEAYSLCELVGRPFYETFTFWPEGFA